jgi:hypothetical protein
MHKEGFGAHQYLRNEKNGKGDIVWVSNGKACKYVALFNTRDKAHTLKLDLADVLMPDEKYDIYDIWQKQSLGEFKNSFKTEIAPHGATLIKITKCRG